MFGSQLGELARTELWHKIQPHDLGITLIGFVLGTRPDDLLQPGFKEMLYCLPFRSDVDPLLEGSLCRFQLLSNLFPRAAVEHFAFALAAYEAQVEHGVPFARALRP